MSSLITNRQGFWAFLTRLRRGRGPTATSFFKIADACHRPDICLFWPCRWQNEFLGELTGEAWPGGAGLLRFKRGVRSVAAFQAQLQRTEGRCIASPEGRGPLRSEIFFSCEAVLSSGVAHALEEPSALVCFDLGHVRACRKSLNDPLNASWPPVASATQH